MTLSEPKALECPNCGAPVAPKLGETFVECDYCGNWIAVGSCKPQPTPTTTIIIETHHKHVHHHRLRDLLESAGLPLRNPRTPVEMGDSGEK